MDLRGWGVTPALYAKLVRSSRPKTIIEVGVWKGATTIAFASNLRDLHLNNTAERGVVIAVDTWLGAVEFWTGGLETTEERDLELRHGYPSVYYTFLSNVVRSGVQDFVIPLPVPSTTGAQILARKRVSADMIHIDGSHEFSDVLSDLRAWAPLGALVNPGGVLIGDDYRVTQLPGVKKAVDTFVAETGFAFRCCPHGKYLVARNATVAELQRRGTMLRATPALRSAVLDGLGDHARAV